MPNYAEYTLQGNNYIKFDELENQTYEGILDELVDLHDTSFPDPKDPTKKQQTYTYHFINPKTGIRETIDVGSVKLFKAFINNDIQEGDRVKIARKGTGFKTTYDVSVVSRGDVAAADETFSAPF